MDNVALVSSLMEVMSEVDHGLVENIRNGQLEDNDEEMMDDFIIEYDLTAMPNENSIDEVLLQVAKPVLIQEPYFVIDCWRTLAREWQTKPDIPTIYQAAEPTRQLFLSSMVFGDLQLLDH